MSTKNLARSAIEGGRTGSNKFDRHHSRAETRAAEKDYLHNVKGDVENWYDYDIEPTKHVYKEFNDKLGPMYHWLSSQVGRLWNDVRSDISKTFDTRTTAGRHIVHDHLLKSVEDHINYDYGQSYYGPEDHTRSYYRHQFYVDINGILREKIVIKRERWSYKIPQFNTEQIANWLSGRIVGKVGKKLFWFIPADKNKKRGGVDKTWRTTWKDRFYGFRFTVLIDETIYKIDPLTKLRMVSEGGAPIIVGTRTVWKPQYPSAFRQGNKLSTKETDYFNNLPEFYQEQILKQSPTSLVKYEPYPDYYSRSY